MQKSSLNLFSKFQLITFLDKGITGIFLVAVVTIFLNKSSNVN